jgi:hypothetical protein
MCRHRVSQSLLEGGKPGPHAAVVHITADPDAHSSDESRVLLERRIQPGTVDAGETGLDAFTNIACQTGGAFDNGSVPIPIQPYEAQKVREQDETAPAFRLGDPTRDEPHTSRIRPSFDQTPKE